MVSPSRKRRAAKHLVVEKQSSVRAACRSMDLQRSSYYYEAKDSSFVQRLKERIEEVCLKNPRYGHRRITAVLKREGWRVNKKRIQRFMRREGLKVTMKSKRRKRIGISTSERKKAQYKGHVWSWDFLHDRTEDGRQLRFLTIVDEYTRECFAIRAGRSLGSTEVIGELRSLMATCGAPEHIRSDNGSEFISAAIKSWLSASSIGTIYIEPGSPWENPYIESFNGKLRDECLNREIFTSVLEARVIVEDWRREYNENRPHSSLGYVPPAEFARLSLTPVATLPPSERGKGEDVLDIAKVLH